MELTLYKSDGSITIFYPGCTTALGVVRALREDGVLATVLRGFTHWKFKRMPLTACPVCRRE